MFYVSGYLSMKNFKYSILKDFILVIRQSDGPAIWGGCVTRRKHRAESWYFVSQQSGHGARRVWRTFCRPGTKFCEHYACRGTSLIGAGKLSPYRISLGALAQCRGTNCLGARNLSRCRNLIACRCACLDATTITNLS